MNASTTVVHAGKKTCHPTLVLDIPHAGRIYPVDYTYICTKVSLQRTEDRFADLLFESLLPMASASVIANFSRTYFDINRSPFIYPGPVIRTKCVDGSTIYKEEPSKEQYYQRLEDCLVPYMDSLRKSVQDVLLQHGHVIHLNLHTFCSYRIDKYSGVREKHPFQIYIGDGNGTTCSDFVTDAFICGFRDAGFSVSLNGPFPGGYIVREVGNPSKRIHSLQIEVMRDVYLKDDLHLDSKKLKTAQQKINTAVSSCLSDLSQVIS